MDDDTFSLLANDVAGQSARLRAVLDEVPHGQRGSSFASFVRMHLDAIDTLAASTVATFSTAAPGMKPVLGAKLTRCREMLSGLHANLVTYASDIGRKDLPAGLLYVIDSLIDDLLKARADPLVHLDWRYMYSTSRVVASWEQLSVKLGVVWPGPAEPVIFNLPGLGPGNAFFAPVLVHEVGHSVIQKNDLVQELLVRLDPAVVSALEAAYLSADPQANIASARDQFQRWSEELLCDALATELTGPSFIFSVAVFFPASAAGHSGPNHPDPAQRFQMTLDQLTSAGWDAPLADYCPNLLAWLHTLPTVPPLVPLTHRETFLRSLVDHASPHVIQVARDYVAGTLTWADFEPNAAELSACLTAGVPPAVLGVQPVPLWHIVLSVWLHAIHLHGDSAAGLVASVEDQDLSRFALKSVEMSQVARLWMSHAP